MNNKGLTLVELIAVLVILSVMALIVTPNIYGSIKNYKEQLYETQIDNIKEAGKNWATDNITMLPEDDTYALSVDIKTLQDGGYLKDKLDNPKGGYFDDTNTFVLIECQKIEDETNNLATNYKYKYGAYYDINEYIIKMAIKYAKSQKISSNTSYTVTDLQNNGYIVNNIKDTNGNNISIPSKEVVVEVNEESNEVKYEASIK